MTDSEQSSLTEQAIYREFVRIVGENLDRGEGLVILPLVGEADVLEFLRTVPAGASMTRLSNVPTGASGRAKHCG